MTVRVILADDHAVVREGIRRILEENSDVEIVAEAGSGRDAVELSGRILPDVVVMDIAMPDMNGIEATRRITTQAPNVRVIALSAYSDRRYVLEALEAGADAYVLKADVADELLRAIDAVTRGRRYLSSEVAGVVVNGYVRGQSPCDRSAASAVLGAREREVLQLVAEGLTSHQIAQRLHIADKTVAAHRHNIMAKLGLHSIAELTKYAVREGLTPP